MAIKLTSEKGKLNRQLPVLMLFALFEDELRNIIFGFANFISKSTFEAVIFIICESRWKKHDQVGSYILLCVEATTRKYERS